MSKYTFVDRHIGPRTAEIKEMLTAISYNSVEQLIADTIPETIRLESDLNLPKAITESRYIEHIKSLAKKNKKEHFLTSARDLELDGVDILFDKIM